MTTAVDVPPGYMRDALGRLVPESIVSDKDKMEDELVRELVSKALAVQESIKEFRSYAFQNVDAFIALVADKFGATIGGRKGNAQLDTFDRELRIQVQVSERVAFGEEIEAARALIEECLQDWTKGSPDELKALIQDAFQKDKAGALNAVRILSLRNLDIKEPRWIKAMQAINEALQVSSSKRLIRLYRRNAEGRYDPVTLDMSSL
ncbi:DUF3164 family protein [Megalodesulfovibrio gigas]|uniref:Putative sulfate transport protein CysZ n=1 Tax=Megalodesulfovibrio gigas (strain ATCC 19364 / DSM 1382 / NCIMB 9332 / VKM B-1759) TaxID=1121448 RepID=T2GDF6_MEGG1|nr:DUF3164 family protein [Megalodesulfovibrio gigas]AGW14146.1 putative sulfate transport protein CysZ [Megalodesulfovibrio gigas DSM 1382 = ATCC 19364]